MRESLVCLLVLVGAGCGGGGDGGSRDAGSAMDAEADAGLAPFMPETRTEVPEEGGLVLRTNVPPRVDDCAAPAPCEDVDGDGLVDAWEDLLLDRLRPLARLDEDESLVDDAEAVTAMVGRVAPAPSGDHVRVFIMLGYSRDYGSCAVGEHNGDSERVALDLAPLTDGSPGDVQVAGAYTAAHEGSARDHGRVFTGADLTMLDHVHEGEPSEPRWVVYPSANKHATYATISICEDISSIPCLDEDCAPDGVSDPSRFDLLMPVVNAGEPDAPRVTDLAIVGFDGDDAWAEQDFCGGRSRASTCSSPVREKLLVDPFE